MNLIKTRIFASARMIMVGAALLVLFTPAYGDSLDASNDNFEPEVKIIQRDDYQMEEYRINGELYMIKIIPSKGIPYYLVDTDGDGLMNIRRNELGPELLTPQWKLFSW